MGKTLGECLLREFVSGRFFEDVNNPKRGEGVRGSNHVYQVLAVRNIRQGENGILGELHVLYTTMGPLSAKKDLELNEYLNDSLKYTR